MDRNPKEEEEQLYSFYKSSLQFAKKKHLKSIAEINLINLIHLEILTKSQKNVIILHILYV